MSCREMCRSCINQPVFLRAAPQNLQAGRAEPKPACNTYEEQQSRRQVLLEARLHTLDLMHTQAAELEIQKARLKQRVPQLE